MKDETKETLGTIGGLALAGAAVMAGAMLVKGAVKGVVHVAGALSDKRAAKKAAKEAPVPKAETQIPTEVKQVESTGSEKEP